MLTLSTTVIQNFTFGQCNLPQTPYVSSLEGNQLITPFTTTGFVGWDGNMGTSRIHNYVPGYPGQNSGPFTLFSSTFWLGGLDDASNIQIASHDYEGGYMPGPLDNTGQVMVNGCLDFNKIWRASRYEVEVHIADWQDNASIDNPVGLSLLTWPAKGNPFFQQYNGFALPNQALAEFIDIDGDGLYNPMNGDYPTFDASLPGVVAEDLLWWVQNNTSFLPGPIAIEIQNTAYAFHCSNDDLPNHTNFLKKRLVNKGNASLNDAYLGFWADPDLGCANDDYIGCSPSLSTVYFYNADNNDDVWGCGNSMGYGSNPPTFAVTLLNRNYNSLAYYINNSTPMGNPQNEADVYNLLKGLWRNGVPYTASGSGYLTPGASTRFAFPDRPLDMNGWSMLSSNLPSDDYRILASDSIGILTPGTTIDFVYAFSYHRTPGLSPWEQVDAMLAEIPSIRQFHDSNYTNGPFCVKSTYNYCQQDCVWPSDLNADGIVNQFDYLYKGVIHTFENTAGVSRMTQNYPWAPLSSSNWGQMMGNGVNLKHLDVDGNGLIESNDAIINYTDRMNSSYTTSSGSNQLGGDITLVRLTNSLPPASACSFGTSTIVQPGCKARFNINVGSSTGQLTDVYGIALTLAYDTSIVKVSNENPNNIIPWFNGSTLGTIEEPNGVTIYNYLTTGVGIDSFFSSRFTLAIKNMQQLGYLSPHLIDTAYIEIKDFMVIQSDGTVLNLGAEVGKILYDDGYYDPTVSTNQVAEASRMVVFPNPSNGNYKIFIPGAQAINVELLSSTGQVVFQQKSLPNNGTVSCAELPNGVYYLKASDSKSVYNTKIIIVHEE